ncbi:MAG: endonuclease [Alphaproteobacteria bacterium]
MGVILERRRALWRAAAERYEQREPVRNKKDTLIRQGDWTDAEDAGRIRNRLARKGLPSAAVDAVIDADSTRSAGSGLMLERILKTSQIQAVDFLTGGARTSRMVGRIVLRGAGARAEGFGTGFLVSPRLMMTNNHVLGDATSAANSVVEFDFIQHRDGSIGVPTTFTFDPTTFFFTDEVLDFTLVAVHPQASDGGSLAGRGWLPLIRESGKILVGEPVNLIQHPEGGPMQIAIRENPVVDVVGNVVHYRADTLQGSSGAPVCNDDWDLAALHHSGVPKTNAAGDFITRGGGVWDGTEEGLDDVVWVANEGIRISRIVAHLDSIPMDPAERALYGDAFMAPESPRPSGLSPFDGTEVPMAADGRNEMALYFKVTITPVGTPATAPTPAPLPLPSGPPVQAALPPPPTNAASRLSGSVTSASHTGPQGGTATPADSLARTLVEERGPAGRAYYDREEDRRQRDAYYAGVDLDSDPASLFDALSQLLIRTHTKKLSYKTARLKHLYPWIDLRPHNLELFSIYSDDEMGAQPVIRRELEALARRRGGALESLSVADLERWISDDDERDVDDADTLEAIPGSHNCEHVVPQSWFGKAQPMRADMHHLFACESRCNSFRGNIPFFDFDPFMESERGDCGRKVGNKFEPSYNHGVVARATLYFLLRYPGKIGDAGREFQPDRLDTLKRWHRAQKVDLYELHRNAEIEKAQGNRNPLIDFPDLIDNIDFLRGFG